MITRYGAELLTAAVTAAMGSAILYGATEYGIGWAKSGPEPGFFPFYIGLIVTIASLGTMVQVTLRRHRFGEVVLDRRQLRIVLGFALPMVAFVIVAKLVGLYVATALYLFLSMRLQGGYRTLLSLAVALGMPVFLYVVLEKGFQVYLLKGPLEAALGL